MGYPSPVIKKRVRLVIVDQSVGRGLAKTFDGVTPVLNRSYLGPPLADPIEPNGNTDGGTWWPLLTDSIFKETGTAISFRNTAVGATGLVEHWCGNNAGVPYNMDDIKTAEWDPNDYLINALAELNVPYFDEYWVFISTAQSDSVADVSAANWTLAQQNIADYFLSQTIDGKRVNVGIGMSTFYPAHAAWYRDKGYPAMLATIASYAENPNVHAIGDLYTGLGEYVELQPDALHITDKSVRIAAGVYHNDLIAVGF